MFAVSFFVDFPSIAHGHFPQDSSGAGRHDDYLCCQYDCFINVVRNKLDLSFLEFVYIGAIAICIEKIQMVYIFQTRPNMYYM